MPRKYMGTETVMKENVLSKFDDAYAIVRTLQMLMVSKVLET